MTGVEKSYHKNDWWSNINWKSIERTVKTFQERISYVSKMGNEKKLKELMELLVKSESAKLLAIYHISQKNRGRFTAGIDGKIYVTPKDRINLSNEKFDYKNYHFQPVIMKLIPKNRNFLKVNNSSKDAILISEGIKNRPLGIMTIKDKVMAKIISFALIAKWEPLFESNVMGYRPGYSRQDAINKISKELKGEEKVILETDIKNFFENIRHKAILEKIGVFYDIIRKILKIKVMENGKIYKCNKGITQGSPLSPILANIALHGMQSLFETQITNGKKMTPKYKVCLIRYADDFIVIAPSRDIIEKWILPKLNQFLQKRGLNLNKEKTRIVTKKEGFKFLGYSIKQKEIISIV